MFAEIIFRHRADAVRAMMICYQGMLVETECQETRLWDLSFVLSNLMP